jgi:hypothetical protein
MRYLAAGVVVTLALVLPAAASAQVWLEDREQSEGPGIKLGESLVLHLGLGAEGGYDTNALYRDESVEGAGRIRITPYVDLATRSKRRRVQDEGVVDASPPKIKFRLGVAGFYDHYFSDVESVSRLNDFGVDTHLNFVLFPEGNFSLLLNATYLRTLQPYESASDARARQSVMPGIGVRIRPGGGTLSFELGYQLRFMYFEDDYLATQNNRHGHDVRFITRWKVFPKTALVSKVRFTPTIYYEDESINENSLPVRSLFGLEGLVSDRFGLKALVGYGASYYARGPQFDSNSGSQFTSILAQGELMFFITPFSNLRLGGERDFVDSFYANFFVKNGGYLSFQQMIGGIVLITLRGEVYRRVYAPFAGPTSSGTLPSHTDRKDTWVNTSLLVEWRAMDWLSFFASAEYLADITDFFYWQDTDGDGVEDTQTGAQFHKFVVFGGVRAHY